MCSITTIFSQKSGSASFLTEGLFSCLKKKTSPEEIFAKAELLATQGLDSVKGRAMRALHPEEREKIVNVVNCAYKYINEVVSLHKAHNPQAYERLMAKVLCAKIGGKFDYQMLLDPKYADYKAFLLANHLQHKMQALGDEVYVFPSVTVGDDTALWEFMTKEPRMDVAGKVIGYNFSYFGKDLFQTDTSYKLAKDYCYLNRKISKYNPITSPEVLPYDVQEADGKFRLEIWTVVNKVSVLRGAHACAVLVNDKGERFGVGRMGIADDVNCGHLLTAFGKKRGVIETPDRFLFLSKEQFRFEKTEILIDEKMYTLIMDKVKGDKVDMEHVTSVLRNNCVSYVQEIMQMAGVNTNTEVHVLLAPFLRHISPEMWEKFHRSTGAMPTWIRRGLYALFVFPVIYVPSVALGLIVKIFSLHNFNGLKPDLTLTDWLFKPWKLSIHHPLILEKWQKAHPRTITIKQEETSCL